VTAWVSSSRKRNRRGSVHERRVRDDGLRAFISGVASAEYSASHALANAAAAKLAHATAAALTDDERDALAAYHAGRGGGCCAICGSRLSSTDHYRARVALTSEGPVVQLFCLRCVVAVEQRGDAS
jgi:hypothetical protein